MTWVTKHHRDTRHTHYYMGFSSICKSKNITNPQPISYSIGTMGSKHCVTCKLIRKSREVDREITQRNRNLESIQKKVKITGITLQGMVLNNLTSNGSDESSISELQKILKVYYPKIHIEDVLIPLLISGQIKISKDIITLCNRERI